MKKLLIYWFRNDLRIADNPALAYACRLAEERGAYLLPVFCHTAAYGALHTRPGEWGFARISQHRQQFLRDNLAQLRHQLNRHHLTLFEFDGELSVQSDFFHYLSQHYVLESIVCEEIAAPEEIAQAQAVRDSGLPLEQIWQSSMYDPTAFDFSLTHMPDQFTAFRRLVEAGNYPIPAPVETDFSNVRALDDPAIHKFACPQNLNPSECYLGPEIDQRSSFPYWTPEFFGGSQAALQHLENYFSGTLPESYKQTRNSLFGTGFSTKFSPWLASGALSARQIMHALHHYEAKHGKNDGSTMIWFELLWRDYFRFLHSKYGAQLYHTSGLSRTRVSLPLLDAEQLRRWTQAQTGEALIDAAMRELIATAYLSNRLRQQVFSYWLHEMKGDWRVGAAWLESQLIDYDVYSNQGNCLYLAGLGTDPRGYSGGRWFDPQKQAKQYDADGSYRQLWSSL